MSQGHHHHAPRTHSRLIGALAITFTIFIAEVIGAVWANSLALAADAGHMLVDSSGLIIAVTASYLMKKPRTDRRTWGMARAEVLAAALQSGMLLIICAVIVWKAIDRIVSPADVHGTTMMIFGVIGLVGNIVSLLILIGDRQANLNIRAAFLEVSTDALGSIAVIVAAGLAAWTGWNQWDVIASFIIAAMMGPRAVLLLRDSLRILMEEAPPELDVSQIRDHMLRVDHVVDVHDLHVTTIATGTVALTAHVTVEDECFASGHAVEILHALQQCVAEHFPISITHSTIQVDSREHRDHEMLEH